MHIVYCFTMLQKLKQNIYLGKKCGNSYTYNTSISMYYTSCFSKKLVLSFFNLRSLHNTLSTL